MNLSRVMLITTLTIIFNACGGGSGSSSSSSKPIVNAGTNKHVVVNESISITGTVKTDKEEALHYEWKENENTLATTKTFVYTPTEAGAYTLSFTVQNSEGVSTTDTMIVIVTTQEIDRNIPSLSEALKSDYLTAINRARTTEQDCRSKGVLPATTTVKWNEKLYKASYEHIQDLIATETFSHDGSGTESDWSGYALSKKSTQVERVQSYRYSWERLGENLAGGTIIDTAEKAVQSWIDSDNHCENLMNPLFTEVGMVQLSDENSLYTNYWGQNFGTAK
ncbi:MAG: SCP-like extracellular [uncultured Sulfurovum sp.]|uniref:SCP-like extracellular n=1 Tax=uncultured Sulfurovum sp. TaxID=269237 RepID=A0A6S6SVN0_9BACT|nr:MAG: SCP-like extracellular [uncultured Sulfurovum sp.]